MAMEAKEIFEAESQSVRKLLCELGVGYYIPPYQRPYSWAKDKVHKLLEDVLHGFNKLLTKEDSFTFLGSIITIHDRDCVTIQPIVRTDVPARVLNVIDGQQRLTTLLLLCVALHNQIGVMRGKLLKPTKGVAPQAPDPVNWLDGQTLTVLAALRETFVQLQPYGTARKYPRMVRAFLDQWSKNADLASYRSPIANLIHQYSDGMDPDKGVIEKPKDFKPSVRPSRIEGEDALVSRYQQIAKTLKSVSQGGAGDIVDVDEVPTIDAIIASTRFQRALLNHEFPAEVVSALKASTASAEYAAQLRLVLLAAYALDRIAVTVVKGKNEDYAFSVFESLNTTGEPLTAFETFRPRVVYAEGLEKYERSESRKHIDGVADYLAEFKAGEQLQAATHNFLVAFASAETGDRLAKRLADQRSYLKDQFSRYEADPVTRLAFVEHLFNTAQFIRYAWESTVPTLQGLPVAACSDSVRLCLAFLNSVGHTMTLGPLVRFYVAAVAATGSDQEQRIKDLETAIKAVTAFSVLWRASRRGTANIDQEYREIMLGSGGMAPLARSLRLDAPEGTPAPAVDAEALRTELRRRLKDKDHGEVPDKAAWVKLAAAIPAYRNSKEVARFVLLAAYHDAVEDKTEPGLIVPGKSGVSQCFTYDGWNDEKHLSVEHIAPRELADGWDAKLYDDKELVDRIGNLVLVQQEANSSLSNRPWSEKAPLYLALGAESQHDAKKVLEDAEQRGIKFKQSTNDLVQMSRHMPHLTAIGAVANAPGKQWDGAMVESRSQRILQLAWDRLSVWLGI